MSILDSTLKRTMKKAMLDAVKNKEYMAYS